MEVLSAASPPPGKRNPGEFDRQNDHVLGLYPHLFDAAVGRCAARHKYGGKDAEVSYSDLLDKIDAQQVQDVTIQGTELHGHLKANPKDQFHTTIPQSTDTLITQAACRQGLLRAQGSAEQHSAAAAVQHRAVRSARRDLVLHAAPDAVRRQQGAVLRQEPRAPALNAAEESHV